MAMVNQPIKNLGLIQVQESQPQMVQNQILKVQNQAPWLVDEIAQFLLVDIMSAKKPTARKNSSKDTLIIIWPIWIINNFLSNFWPNSIIFDFIFDPFLG